MIVGNVLDEAAAPVRFWQQLEIIQ
jgi:hypothetical protein